MAGPCERPAEPFSDISHYPQATYDKPHIDLNCRRFPSHRSPDTEFGFTRFLPKSRPGVIFAPNPRQIGWPVEKSMASADAQA